MCWSWTNTWHQLSSRMTVDPMNNSSSCDSQLLLANGTIKVTVWCYTGNAWKYVASWQFVGCKVATVISITVTLKWWFWTKLSRGIPIHLLWRDGCHVVTGMWRLVGVRTRNVSGQKIFDTMCRDFLVSLEKQTQNPKVLEVNDKKCAKAAAITKATPQRQRQKIPLKSGWTV